MLTDIERLEAIQSLLRVKSLPDHNITLKMIIQFSRYTPLKYVFETLYIKQIRLNVILVQQISYRRHLPLTTQDVVKLFESILQTVDTYVQLIVARSQPKGVAV